MPIETTYTNLRQNLSSVLDSVCNDQEVVVVRRRDRGAVALIPADELSSLMETAHLLRSPANAARLLSALQEGRSGQLQPSSVADLRLELGLGQD